MYKSFINAIYYAEKRRNFLLPIYIENGKYFQEKKFKDKCLKLKMDIVNWIWLQNKA